MNSLYRMSVTFVSSFIDLEEERKDCKSIDTYISKFSILSKLKISIHLFVSKSFQTKIESLALDENVYIEYIDFKELLTYKETQLVKPQLPARRCPNKDTYNYMVCINSKIEFIEKAIRKNKFQTTHFAWIDFGIFHVIKNIEATSKWLEEISVNTWKNGIIIPGCWSKEQTRDAIFSRINWRFCGGFLLGDSQSLLEFYDLYRKHYKEIIETNLMWEVNVWSYLENFCNWSPYWYKADHNDSILQIPLSFALQKNDLSI